MRSMQLMAGCNGGASCGSMRPPAPPIARCQAAAQRSGGGRWSSLSVLVARASSRSDEQQQWMQLQRQQPGHQQPPRAGAEPTATGGGASAAAAALAALQVLAAAVAAAPPPLLLLPLLLPLAAAAPPPAEAVLNSPNARIPRTAEAALRRSIPAFNQDVAAMQKSLEDVAYLLRIPQRKPWGNMASDVAAALAAFDDRGRLTAGVPPGDAEQQRRAAEVLDALLAKLKELELAVKTQQADYTDVRVADCLRLVADLELLQAPGLTFSVPAAYADRPTLRGRAVVELTVEKGDGSLAFVDAARGGLTARGAVRLTLDGYSAPVSAGAFAANVRDGLYDGSRVAASYASVVAGRGDGPAGRSLPPRRPVPLENLPAGEFDPVYRISLDVAGGELPTLPLSIPGAVSFARLSADELAGFSGSGQPPSLDGFLSGESVFIGKFTKQQAGLAGLAFDEGEFGVFGYAADRASLDVVDALQPGDVIVSARIVSGEDRLVVPAAAAAPAGSQ